MTPESSNLPEIKETPAGANEATPLVAASAADDGPVSDTMPPAILASLAAKLPLQLDLCVPLPKFRVQNLLALEKGQVIESAWSHTEDLPLWSGGIHLVWTEFEVVDQKLAVRVTRLV